MLVVVVVLVVMVVVVVVVVMEYRQPRDNCEVEREAWQPYYSAVQSVQRLL